MKKKAMFFILLFVAVATFPILAQTPDSIYKKNNTDKRTMDNSGYHSGSATMTDTVKGNWNSNDMKNDTLKLTKKKKLKSSESGSSSGTTDENGTPVSSPPVTPNSTQSTGTSNDNSNNSGTSVPPASSSSSSTTEKK